MKTATILTRPENDVEIWDKWNSTYRQGRLDEPSKVRLHAIGAMMTKLGVKDAKIFEAGCGTGWLANRLSDFGQVSACDIGNEILVVAQQAYPQIKFMSGDVQSLDLPIDHFDVVVTSEVLSHVPDQAAFIHRLAQLLKRGGYLVLTTQNKTVFERTANVAPPDGWIRQWLTMGGLKRLLQNDFAIKYATTLEPEGHMGFLRLVNSRRLNDYLNTIVGAPRVKRLKEQAGFGQSLFVVAAKR